MWHSVMAIFYRIEELEECRLKLEATAYADASRLRHRPYACKELAQA